MAEHDMPWSDSQGTSPVVESPEHDDIHMSWSQGTRRVVESPEDTSMSGYKIPTESEKSDSFFSARSAVATEQLRPESEQPYGETEFSSSPPPSDIFGFNFHGEGVPIEPLENQVGEPSDPVGLAFRNLDKSFGYNALNLLDPNHAISQEHPQISRTFRAYLKAVFDKQGRRDFSLCECHGGTWLDSAGHDEKFQNTQSPFYQEVEKIPAPQRTTAKLRVLCPTLKERIRVYGVLGEGTFGIAFLAREWDGDEAIPTENPEQYAIKGQAHKTVVHELLIEKASYPEMCCFVEPTGRRHYIPMEAIAMIYLNNSDRFPTVDSIYVHGLQWAMVMRACVDVFPEGRADIPNQESFLQPHHGILRYDLPNFPPFSGIYLTNNDHNVVVSEMEGCKIASQFLQGLVQLADLRIAHGDISVNNYLVDQELNVKLIDLGVMSFSPTADGFRATHEVVLAYQEYQNRPEAAVEHLKLDRLRALGGPAIVPKALFLPNDRSDVSVWKYSTLVYGFLHGYWPWEKRIISQNWHTHFNGEYEHRHYPEVKNRRKRMINEDVTIDETLSQDCQDMLQAALSRNIEDRPKLQEMASFPWFPQWSAAEVESGRPLKRPRVARYASAQRGKGRTISESEIWGGEP